MSSDDAWSVARKASTNDDGSSGVPPFCSVAAAARRTRDASVCDASHRLNSSRSLAARKASSASDRSSASFTGAEKPRRSDGVGGASMPSKWKDCSASRSSRTFVGAASEPSAARRPTATGMWNGSLFGCPGVASVDCESVNVYRLAAASYAPWHLSVGVPACVYHRSNCVRSTLLASAIAARKSSHVTAWPSWRSK